MCVYISFDWWVRAFVVLSLVSSIPSQENGVEKRLRNDLFCVQWDVKPQLNQSIWLKTVLLYNSGNGPTQQGRAEKRHAYKVLVEVSLRLAVRDARHHLVVVELVAQLAEVASHRDHLVHSCNSSINTCGTPYTGSQSPSSPAPLLLQQQQQVHINTCGTPCTGRQSRTWSAVRVSDSSRHEDHYKGHIPLTVSGYLGYLWIK